MTNKNKIKFVKSKISLLLSVMVLGLGTNTMANAANEIDGIPSIPPAATNSAGSLPPVQLNGAPTYSQQNQVSSGQVATPAAPIMPQSMVSAPQSLPPLPQDPNKPNASDLDSVMSDYFSVTPTEIMNMRQKADERAKAAAELPVSEPKPVTGSISVSLEPGSQPPIIRPFLNNTTTFVVIDSTGQPWPVENFVVGNETAFSVKRFDLNPKGSSFSIVPKGMYAKTNLALKLEGQDTPVVINLMAGQHEVDSRVEVRVQGRGPNAMINSGTMVEGTDARLLPVLDGIAPENSKRLQVLGDANTSVWLTNNRFVVRTPLKIISPASNSFISSAEGNMNVYVITKVPTIRGITKDGKIITVNIKGY